MNTPADHTYDGVLAQIFAYLEEHRTVHPGAQISAQSRLIHDLGLDSLTSFEMVSDLEDHFGVCVPMDLFQHVITVEDVVRAMLRVLHGDTAPGGDVHA